MDVEMGSAMEIIAVGCVPPALKAIMELGVLDILAKAGLGAELTAAEIVSQLPTKNPNASDMLERILKLLASYSILSSSSCSPDGRRCYGLTPMCKDLLPRQDGGGSMAETLLVSQDEVLMECWYYFKDAVLEGCVPFVKANGTSLYDYYRKDAGWSKLFNEGMYNLSVKIMMEVLDNYSGFEGLKEVVDVGGGAGAALRMIISKYPHIRGINFDLPHVVATNPPIPGVKNVSGDMFENVPSGDHTIILKWILHNWDDERSVNILRNCWKALPDSGKVIIVEYIMPENAETDRTSRLAISYDIYMLAAFEGGKERTLREFEELAKKTGFTTIKAFPLPNGMAVIEFYKSP